MDDIPFDFDSDSEDSILDIDLDDIGRRNDELRSQGRIYAGSTQVGLQRLRNRFEEYFQYLSKKSNTSTFSLTSSDDAIRGFNMSIISGFLEWAIQVALKDKRRPPMICSLKKYYIGMGVLHCRLTSNRPTQQQNADAQKFIESSLAKKYKLPIQQREKPTLMWEQYEHLIRSLWEQLDGISYERIRIQIAFVLHIQAYTSTRPGSIVESSCYFGSNQAVLYEDFQLALVKDEDNNQVWTLRYSNNLMKGRRKDEFIGHQPTIYTMYESTDPATCPILLFMALALEDGALEDISNAEELFQLSLPSDIDILRLNIAEEKMKTPVLRAPEKRPGFFGISSTRAFQYDQYERTLRDLGLEAGFQCDVRSYLLRRSAANAINRISDEDQQNLSLGHHSKSVFSHYYRSNAVQVDTQAAFRGDRPSKVAMMISSQLTIIDPKAPKSLNSVQKTAISNTPRIVNTQKKLDRRKEELTTRYGSIAKAKRSPEGKEEATRYEKAKQRFRRQIIALEREELRKIRAKHFRTAESRHVRSQIHGEPIPESTNIDTGAEIVLPSQIRISDRQDLIDTFYGSPQLSKPETVELLRRLCRTGTGCISQIQECRFCGESKEFLEDHLQKYHLPELLKQKRMSLPGHGLFCVYCMNDTSLPPSTRVRCFGKQYNRARHIDLIHWKAEIPSKDYPCPHRTCPSGPTTYARQNLMNQLHSVHDIRFPPSTVSSLSHNDHEDDQPKTTRGDSRSFNPPVPVGNPDLSILEQQ